MNLTCTKVEKPLHIRDSDRLTLLLEAVDRGIIRVFLDDDKNEVSQKELESWLDIEVERDRNL